MNFLTRVLAVLARAVSDRLIGRENTGDLIQAFQDWRASAPAAATLPEGAIAGAASGLQEVTEQNRDEARTLLQGAAPQLALVLGDASIPPAQAVSLLLDQFPVAGGTYIVWLDAPPLEGRPCYVHFYFENRGEGRERAFSVRDFVNGHFYFGHRASAPRRTERLAAIVGWNDRTAAEIWGSARKRKRCQAREGTEFPVKEEDRWKALLEEMTRTHSP